MKLPQTLWEVTKGVNFGLVVLGALVLIMQPVYHTGKWLAAKNAKQYGKEIEQVSRCYRCDGCRNQWEEAEGKPCPHCNWPLKDTRTKWQRFKDWVNGYGYDIL